ncbi:hypothetical protein HCUR_00314 [Holospora curviuscula]|uniref:Uncharacterized protein n=1 Tax=Holospora curviuscula TaxID=1082868 RepID=A0A2S5RE03_9PROT|nr:hypothetical protein HCUR_00314 [Holospora curviuscula]
MEIFIAINLSLNEMKKLSEAALANCERIIQGVKDYNFKKKPLNIEKFTYYI